MDLLQLTPDRVFLFVRSDLDYERRCSYSYVVVATDAGQPRLTGTSQLDVEVIDVDDELPHFDVPHYRFHITENLPVGSLVGQVRATDRDTDPQFRRVYYFIDKEETSSFLMVDQQTGELRTLAVLDREVTPALTVSVFHLTYSIRWLIRI